MCNYVIFTDSACDLSAEMLKERKVNYASLFFRFDGEEQIYSNSAMPLKEFYDRVRAGGVAKTSAVNPDTFAVAFEQILKEGKDILYLGFSSGLSTTFNSARIAAENLKQDYPDRKIIVVDSLAASAGLGLLLDIVVEKKNSGASIEEAAKFAEDIKLNICHWFTVDDLVYLKRGGRISPSAAFFGNMLGIKPVLHVDKEGHLVNVQKVRGRKLAIETLASKCNETIRRDYPLKAYISQADCENDANELAKILETKYGIKTEVITEIGAVIGAHSGPGTLALFFVGTER
jgi:DegV family protein with EDD domain